MPQENPVKNLNVASTLRLAETALSGPGFIIAGFGSPANPYSDMSTVHTLNQAINVSIAEINTLNLIVNDNDCGNAFFHTVIESLENKGLKITTSRHNDNLMYENATVITLDQKMIAGEGVAFIGPCQSGTANNSEALLKSMQVTFRQQGWPTEAFAGVMQYSPNNTGVYHGFPSKTENSVLPDSTYITILLGTMPTGFDADKVAEGITLSLARYKYYLDNYSKNVTIVSNPTTHTQAQALANNNHYLFNAQIEASPSFSSDLSFGITREVHHSK